MDTRKIWNVTEREKEVAAMKRANLRKYRHTLIAHRRNRYAFVIIPLMIAIAYMAVKIALLF